MYFNDKTAPTIFSTYPVSIMQSVSFTCAKPDTFLFSLQKLFLKPYYVIFYEGRATLRIKVIDRQLDWKRGCALHRVADSGSENGTQENGTTASMLIFND